MIPTTDSFFTAIGDKTVIKAPSSVRIVSYAQIRHPRSIGRRRVGIIITVPLSQNKLGDYTGDVTKHVSNNWTWFGSRIINVTSTHNLLVKFVNLISVFILNTHLGLCEQCLRLSSRNLGHWFTNRTARPRQHPDDWSIFEPPRVKLQACLKESQAQLALWRWWLGQKMIAAENSHVGPRQKCCI